MKQTDYGELQVSVIRDPYADRTWLHIEHADPRILISEAVLNSICKGLFPGDTLSVGTHLMLSVSGTQRHRPGRYTGALLKIPATNRSVVYRIRQYLPAAGAYIAEWPD